MNSTERGSGYRDTPAVGQEKARSTQPTGYSGVHNLLRELVRVAELAAC